MKYSVPLILICIINIVYTIICNSGIVNAWVGRLCGWGSALIIALMLYRSEHNAELLDEQLTKEIAFNKARNL